MSASTRRSITIGSATALICLAMFASGCTSSPTAPTTTTNPPTTATSAPVTTTAPSATAPSTTAPSASAAGCDFAPNYPKGPIEFIVPWAAGGGTDAVARVIAASLSKQLGVQVNVVNRTGGAGVIGHDAMRTAKPDGQSFGLATAELAMMHWQGLTAMTYKDFTPISLMNADHSAISVKAGGQWTSVKALLDYIKANPGKLKASGTATGGIGHLGMIGVLMAMGLPVDSVTWVPSDGAAPAVQELVSGGVDFVVTSSPAEVKAQTEAGAVKPLAVLNDVADPNFPNIPTLKAETGKSYIFGTWRGIVGPKGMDQNVVNELQCYLSQTIKEADFTSLMAKSGYGIQYLNAADFASFLAQQDTQMGDVMAAAGLKK